MFDRSFLSSLAKWAQTWSIDTQWRHKLKKSEHFGWCERQKMHQLHLKIWEWELIFGHAVKTISSLGIWSPWVHLDLDSITNMQQLALSTLDLKSER